MLNMEKFELSPIDGRKSFYGKARVMVDKEAYTAYLFSYDTIVCTYNYHSKVFRRTWHDYSVTTMRHVNAFRAFYGMSVMTKREWCALCPYM